MVDKNDFIKQDYINLLSVIVHAFHNIAYNNKNHEH